MRLLRIVLLPGLFLLFAAPTCLQSATPTGRGTYVGTAASADDQTVHDVAVIGRLATSRGASLYERLVPLCPSVLLPGERGAFESEPFVIPTDIPLEDQPVNVDFKSFADETPGFGARRPDGLLAREISRDAQAKVVRLEVTNHSATAYRNLLVCGVIYDVGNVSSVAQTELPGFDLRPGAKIPVELRFTQVTQGRMRFYAFGETDAPAPSCCPADGPSTWISVKNQKFSVALPPGWAYEPENGNDSFVGRYYSGDTELSFDYGIYSDDLRYEGDPAYEVHEETIGGFTAKIVRAKGARGVTGVHFVNVETFRFPRDTVAFPVELTIQGTDLTPEQQALAIQILRSIRFP